MQNQQGGGGDQQEQIMQIIQAYAQATQTDPKKIIQQLQQMDPKQQQVAIIQMAKALQGGGGQEEQQGGMDPRMMDPRMQQQMMAQQGQPPMQYGGYMEDGGSTYSGNQFFNYGGAYIPTYGEYAYGGPMTEYPGYFNQQSPMMYGGDMAYGGSMNNGMMSYDNQYAKGGGIHINPSKRGTFTAAATKHGKSVQGYASQVLANKENYSPAMVKKANFARNAAKWKHEEGGIVVGQTMEATPELLQKLKEGGYTFEYVR
jgi:hypothetical protein